MTGPNEPDAADLEFQKIVHENTGDYADNFEAVYAAAAEGKVEVPWGAVRERHHWLRRWAAERQLDGTGKRAVVVGCGFGHDAEFVATLGYDTTAFDISPSGIRMAQERHPGSPVNYVVASVLEPPAEWVRAFDLVVEISTVQALPRAMRAEVTEAIGNLVAPGGTLIVISTAQQGPVDDADYGPWPLTRDEVEAFTTVGLNAVEVIQAEDAEDPSIRRWRAEFRRT